MRRKPTWLRSMKCEPLPISNEEMARRTVERDSTGMGLITICWLTLLGYGLAALLLTGCASSAPFVGYEDALEVNRIAKQQFSYAPRPAGQASRAMKPGDKGDCADHAVTKCAMMLERGFKRERLSFARFDNRNGIPHAVCVVDGRWALDWKPYPVDLRTIAGVKHIILAVKLPGAR